MGHNEQGHGSGFYDFVAKRIFRGTYRRLAKDFAATVAQGAHVLDAGTGPGILLVELARLRPDLRLTGVDLSADMAGAAAKNLARYGDRATVRVADVASLPFPDASFDAIVSSLSLHHWEHPEQGARELARVLRPDGRICVYDFAFAPFEVFGDVLEGQPARTPIRTGNPFLRRCVRCTGQRRAGR